MPQNGDFFVTATGGFVGWAIRKITKSPVNHAGVYVGVGRIIEAEGNGAAVADASKYPNAIWSNSNLDVATANKVHDNAVAIVGTPYNFIDIAAQFIVRVFGWKAPKFVLKRLSDPRRLQCAQLVDLVYQRSGIELLKDGRPNGLISPEDLRQVILSGVPEKAA